MFAVTIFVVTFTFIVSVVWYATFFFYLRRVVCNVPGPLPLPVLGNWLSSLWPRRTTLEPTGFRPIECYWLGVLGTKPYVFICDPDLVKEVAVDQRDILVDRGDRDVTKILAGNSLDCVITSRSELAQCQRDKLAPVLRSREVIDQYVSEIQSEAPRLRASLNGDASIDASEKIYEHMLNVGEGGLLGFRESTTDPRFQRGRECKKRDRAFAAWSAIASQSVLPTSWWHALASLPLIRTFSGYHAINQMIDDHRGTLADQLETSNDGDTPTPLVQAILELGEHEIANGLSAETAQHRVVSHLVAFSNGASKNEAAIACFALREMAKNPAIQLRLFEEIETNFGSDGPIDPDRLISMEYLQAVIRESLRLRPAFPVFTKIANQPTMVGGYHIGSDVEVAIRVRSLQRHPNYWDNGDRFDPQRHLSLDSKQRHPFTYIPFGFGRRHCPGQAIAKMGMSLMLCQIVQNYQIELPVNDHEPLEQMSLAISLDRATKLCFRSRSIEPPVNPPIEPKRQSNARCPFATGSTS